MNFSRTIGPGIRPGNSGPILGRGPGSGGGSAGAGITRRVFLINRSFDIPIKTHERFI